MEWSKLKTVIILILALLNAFLLFLVMSREIQDTRAQEQARQDAIAVIQSSGVILENETVPRTAALQPQMVTRDLDAEGELARRVLSETTTNGVRVRRCGKYFLSPGAGLVQTQWGPVKLKLARGSGITHVKPEFEDAARLARENGVPYPEVLREVWQKL